MIMQTNRKLLVLALSALLIPVFAFNQAFSKPEALDAGFSQQTISTAETAAAKPADSAPSPAAAAEVKPSQPAPPAPSQAKQVKKPAGKTGSGAQTIIGKSPVIGAYTQNDLYLLAKMVYAEAGFEPYNGQVAVAAVILHRVASPNYPNTIKGVEFQVIDGHYQFTPVLNGYINQVEPNAQAYQAARQALAGVDPSKGAMLYYNPATSSNKWILSRPVTAVIGNHTFAK